MSPMPTPPLTSSPGGRPPRSPPPASPTTSTRAGPGPGRRPAARDPGHDPAGHGAGEPPGRRGFTVAVPSLFGEPGRALSAGYALRTIAQGLHHPEFAAFARSADRPIAEYVRALARHLHEQAGGPGVGVIGMCFSGGFALAAAVEPAVLAPVGSQPSVPFPIGAARKRDLGMSERERAVIAERVRTEGLCLVGLRFSEDTASPGGPVRRAREGVRPGLAGDPAGLEPRQSRTASASASTRCSPAPTSTKPGHPTHEARAEVTAFLKERLTG